MLQLSTSLDAGGTTEFWAFADEVHTEMETQVSSGHIFIILSWKQCSGSCPTGSHHHMHAHVGLLGVRVICFAHSGSLCCYLLRLTELAKPVESWRLR